MRRAFTAVVSGVLFGVGLVVSGMVDPRNVIAFLDFTGAWNPRLAAVMAGAVGVHASLLWLGGARGGQAKLLGAGSVDAQLVIGAAIFGVGWGLSGYCPGPAVVAVGFGAGRALAFVAAIVAGAWAADALLAPRPEPACLDAGDQPTFSA